MTLDEIRSSTKTVLTPEDVCDVLGCKPYSINQQAKANAARLGFPVTIIRSFWRARKSPSATAVLRVRK